MNLKWVLLILFVLCVSCGNNNQQEYVGPISDKVIIKGVLEQGENHLVTIDRMGPMAFIPIDSVHCNKKGEFRIELQAAYMDYYALKYTEQGYITIIAKPGDKIEINGTANNIHPYTVKGSNPSALVGKLSLAHKNILDQLKDISTESNNIQGQTNYSEIKQELNERFDSITEAFHFYSKEFIVLNSGSPATLIALYNQYGPGLPVFNPLTDLDIYQNIDSVLFALYPENDAVKSLHSELNAALQQLRNQNDSEKLLVGMKAPDFVMPNEKGEPFALKELRGKYVLIQFWASWSKPSIDENRFLQQCYSQFSEKNFAILQVSIDNMRQSWLDNIDTEKPNWYHVSDLQHWDSRVVDLYRVERIPANFLINPNGKIIETNLYGDEMINTISKYLN